MFRSFFGNNNATYHQPPPQPIPQGFTDATYREAMARQQAQYDAYTRAHNLQQQQFAAENQRQARQAHQVQQDFLRQSLGGGGARVPEMFTGFGRDSDDEEDMVSRAQHRVCISYTRIYSRHMLIRI